MEILSSSSSKLNGYEYAGKGATIFMVAACITAASGAIIFGYDLGISGGVTSMDDFLLKFFPRVYEQKNSAKTDNYCKFDSQVLTAFTSSLYLAALVTNLLASVVTSRYGRRACILTGGICFMVGSVLNGAAQDLAMLLLGRIVLGLGLGFTTQTVPLYLSEMAPPGLRGGLNSMAQIALCIGVVSAYLINYGTARIKPWGWRISLGSSIFPSIFITLGAVFLPDTPSSLIERGKCEHALLVLQKMRGTLDVQAEYNDLLEASRVVKAVGNHPWSHILKPKYRPVLVMAFGIPWFQQFTGINIVTFYAPVLFQTLGLGSNASLYSSVILGGAGLLAAILAAVLVDKAGRRSLLFHGSLQMFITLVIIAVVLYMDLGAHNMVSRNMAILLVVTVCVYVAAFGWSWGPVGTLVPSEVFPLEVRAAGQSINIGVVLFFIFAGAQLFLAMLCHLKAGLFLFMACWVFLSALFVYFLLPETKGQKRERSSDPDTKGKKKMQVELEKPFMVQRETSVLQGLTSELLARHDTLIFWAVVNNPNGERMAVIKQPESFQQLLSS
ncbi:hypothetical protein GOP47_0010595 [Adiantum capillus-veneris]|uniref:Major facilitator superfamily (MFS) profile domain-containing protein n=1 Tax=Adiantum capillus-veneris TaxID=13818 RepID=A0A9D4ZGJ3_ADICA|nr:hypothetical protein GOP47_0010595 [Adiantum capillus-veneris]